MADNSDDPVMQDQDVIKGAHEHSPQPGAARRAHGSPDCRPSRRRSECGRPGHARQPGGLRESAFAAGSQFGATGQETSVRAGASTSVREGPPQTSSL